ncbi:hypothetical protein A9K97_gp142 [Tokyovirus A1]|uniref:hypothetical protein n=1 Tax=Tokyovirus A1 TaxID=1826170 RepID=UPI0007A989BD|nr:hypothetical protein A9K97_gp142 [Tokyovirus A1]BAU80209.1 conserved hypothetical protein [Tokyovirus A1]
MSRNTKNVKKIALSVSPLEFDVNNLVVKKVASRKGAVAFEMVDLAYKYPGGKEEKLMVKFARCFTFGLKNCYKFQAAKTDENIKPGEFEFSIVPYSKEWATNPTPMDIALEKMEREIIDKVRAVCAKDDGISEKLQKKFKKKNPDYKDAEDCGVSPIFGWQKEKREEGDKRKDMPIDPTKQKIFNVKTLSSRGGGGKPVTMYSVFRAPKKADALDYRTLLKKTGDTAACVIFEGFFVKGTEKLCLQPKLYDAVFTEKAREYVPAADDDEFDEEEEKAVEEKEEFDESDEEETLDD